MIVVPASDYLVVADVIRTLADQGVGVERLWVDVRQDEMQLKSTDGEVYGVHHYSLTEGPTAV